MDCNYFGRGREFLKGFPNSWKEALWKVSFRGREERGVGKENIALGEDVIFVVVVVFRVCI